MSNEFDDAVTATMQPDPAQAARVGFSVAADTNPDAYAEARRVARTTGVPVDTVLSMPNEMKRQAAVGSVDFGSLAQTSPATAALLADVETVDELQELKKLAALSKGAKILVAVVLGAVSLVGADKMIDLIARH
jgi:hypothetical protein